MECVKSQVGDALEVRIKGRLDGYWADHLSKALDQMVRDGAHRIRMDLAEVSYMSSAGIAVLVKFYKQLAEIHGSFAVARLSPQVKKVLVMAGLSTFLINEAMPVRMAIVPVRMFKQLDPESPTFEVSDLVPGAKLTCRTVGDPRLLRGCRFSGEHVRTMTFPDSVFALGLGAFGHSFDDSARSFGEFLAAAGTAAYLPTDGTNAPDYLVSTGDFFPELMVLYSLVCEGQFSHLARFEPKTESSAAGLTRLAATCLDIAESRAVGIVMVAESAGLIGAALRRSPTQRGSEFAPFRHPEVREWLSFSAERAYAQSLALVVGVAARGECGALAPMLRPFGREPDLVGHFHAAAFSYRPLQKGRVELKPTVAKLFESEKLQGVLHLLGDDREISGVGQSEFVRGACWIGSIDEAKGIV